MSLPIHREGLPIIGILVAGAAALWILHAPLGWAGAALAAWSAWFFRDPERRPPAIPNAILSPADGRLLPLVKAPPPPELAMGDAPRTRISIFMNIFDVHVNRIPADGTITAIHYRPGRFVNAAFDKASDENERLAARMTTADGTELAFVQIAGLVARRIRSTLAVGDRVRAGARFGIIRFGSRVDVYLPDGVAPRGRAGARMVAGETVIAVPGANTAAGGAAAVGGDGTP
jgi:phosphatidylserine decarboxylase